MLEISPTSPGQINLDRPSNIAASEQNIEHFKRLMSGIDKGLSKGTASFEARETEATNPISNEPPPLEVKTALELQKAEYNIGRIKRHLLGGIQKLEGGHTMNGGFVQAITQQQFTSAYYFLGVGRVSNSAEDTSEEINSVTRGR
jgi:hypothetical protein